MMKKSLLTLLLAMGLSFSVVSGSYAEYEIIQLTDNEYRDNRPWINSYGQVIWEREVGEGLWAIMFYDGTAEMQLTDEYSTIGTLNDSGHVVWTAGFPASPNEIFMYDGTDTIQLTDNDYTDSSCSINNQGQVVWMGEPGIGYTQVFIYDGEDVIQITDNDTHNRYPRMNDRGHIVWAADAPLSEDPMTREIFVYDGEEIIQITDNEYQDEHPRMNNNGQVVWIGEVHRDDPGAYSPDEIFFYDGTDIIQLTDNGCQDFDPQVGDNGHVVWVEMTADTPGSDCLDEEIFLYDGTDIIRITDNDFDDHKPDINGHGHVVWERHYQAGESDAEIYLYDGTSATQLTDNDYNDWNPQINDLGQIVWESGPMDEIFLATKTFHYEEETTPEDPVVDTPDGSTITFDTITEGGITTVGKIIDTPQLSGNFQLLSTPCYVYDINTTAVFENIVSVCIKYDQPPTSFDENQIGLLHEEDGIFVDRTISLDTLNNIVCAEVDGFSDFVVVVQGESETGWGAASTVGTRPGSSSDPLNCLLILIAPISATILVRIWRRKR